ncbi:transcriptional regulator GcvA [Pantoea rwandensis]|uniref:XRE family transcriptional regulator n=1 Tax=Pantoea rwandensis TaxID=1076550 RepID=A0A1X1D0V1_9GAMM|nr:transcriptional regulator GcvA [Pantoea rwandensis]ORM70309.1 XRE family transcriptional regulator [Pantoea rwandensis]
MMIKKLPNLGAVRFFEVASRLNSFSRAAEELCVTHSAVSHQIRALEADLGVQLFKRDGRRVTLTPSGEIYARQIRSALVEISEASELLRSEERGRRLVISVLPSFASRWLLGRIGSFIDRYPEIDVDIQSTNTMTDFSRDDVDVVIRFNETGATELFVEPVMNDVFFPVCSPFYNQGSLPKDPESLLSHKLLRNDYAMWKSWFLEAGISGAEEPQKGVLYKDASQQIQAAIDGQGIALVRQSLAMQAIQEGTLVRLTQIKVASHWSYWFICPHALINSDRLNIFRDWIHDEAKSFMKSLENY